MMTLNFAAIRRELLDRGRFNGWYESDGSFPAPFKGYK